MGRLLTAALAECDLQIELRARDLAALPLPAVSADFAQALVTPPERLGARERASCALSDELIAELEQTDLLLITSPMHNYTVPVVLKAWIDHVVRRGASFRTTPQGKVGLLRDRPTLVAVSAGGSIFEDQAQQPDFFRPYLAAVLRAIGITDVRFVAFERATAHADPLTAAARFTREWIAANLPEVSA